MLVFLGVKEVLVDELLKEIQMRFKLGITSARSGASPALKVVDPEGSNE